LVPAASPFLKFARECYEHGFERGRMTRGAEEQLEQQKRATQSDIARIKTRMENELIHIPAPSVD
jgi:hypothetical protein